MSDSHEVGAQREQYMVGLEPLTSRTLEQFFEQSGIDVIDQVGSPDKPIYVVLLKQEEARQLLDVFGAPRITVELDELVEPL